MAKRTIYVREEDQALFDRLAEDGNLSAIIARAVKADQSKPAGTTEVYLPFGRAPEDETLALYSRGGQFLEFSVEPPQKKESLYTYMQVDPLQVEVGRGLLPLVDPRQGALLLERVTSIRRLIASELGLVMPGVRFMDNTRLSPNEFRLRVRGVEAARGEVEAERILAVGSQDRRLKGTRTVDPTSGSPAVWISSDQQEEAERLGCRVLDATSVVASVLTHVVRTHAMELLGVEEVEALLTPFRKTHPHLVALALPEPEATVSFWRVLRGLVAEHVPIRDLEAILGAFVLAERRPEAALEGARLALRRQLSCEYANGDGELCALVWEPETGQPPRLDELEERLQAQAAQGLHPVLLTTAEQRPRLARLLEHRVPYVPVLSWPEVAPGTRVRILETVSNP